MTFGATDTEQTFTLTATDDTDAETGESVALSFGTLPAGVTAGTPSQATVTITDNDVLPVVTIAADNNIGADWSGVPESVTFGATDTEQTFTLQAADYTDDTDADLTASAGAGAGRRERGALRRLRDAVRPA